MTAYRWLDGRLEAVPWTKTVMLEARTAPLPGLLSSPLSRRQRRRDARVGTRGRRGARQVSPWEPDLAMRSVPLEYRRWVAHLYSDGVARVTLYLLDGEQPGAEHAKAMTLACRGRL